LTKGQAEAAEAKHGNEAVQATVELRVCVELVDETELAIAPRPCFRKDAFDKRPRPLKLLVRELLGERPASTWFGIGR